MSKCLLQRMGQQWPASRAGALAVAVLGGTACWHKLFGRRLPLLPLHLPKFGFRPNYEEETQTHPSEENWIEDLLTMALPTRLRLSFPHSQSIPPGSLYKPLILIHQRADRMKTTATKN